MLKRFLTNEEAALLKEERQQLTLLRGPLTHLDASSEDLALLDRALLQLDELFLLVIVGEFNSGKSAFINALLGQRFLVEGVTPTTAAIHILKYGDEAEHVETDRDVMVATYPVEWLRDINIVDTPGTNAIIRRHQEITEDFVPRADLVLFVTSADRPFSESERAFIERIREWGKKVVFVVNKIDILEGRAEVEHIVQFVTENARKLLGRIPTVFAVSARQARQAKESIDADERTRLWRASQFEPLESYILRTLDEKERLRLKLANPLGVAQRLVQRYLDIAEAAYPAQGRRGDRPHHRGATRGLRERHAPQFKYHLSHVDNVLYGMSVRGNNFFDETIRIQRIFDLVNADRVRGMFEREVVADTSAQVEAHTRDLIDWLVDQDYRQWQGVMDYLNKRIARHSSQIIGQVGGTFESNRQQLLESVGRSAREVVATYDHQAEARELGESVQRAVAQTAIVEVGAIGLGALLVKVLATALADVTGVLAAGALAAVGFYVIPNKRRRAKLDLQEKIDELRGRLNAALSGQFETELGRSLARVRDAMAPYTRFVETQQATLGTTTEALQEAERKLEVLARRVAEG